MNKNDSQTIMCPISIGELMDKITILEIKLKKISGKRLEHVKKELAYLNDLQETIEQPAGLDNLVRELEIINESMWDINAMKRAKAQSGEIDEEFIRVSIREDVENDKRFEIKQKINNLCRSTIIEQKGYDKYNEQK